jgi:hypothetical protein
VRPGRLDNLLSALCVSPGYNCPSEKLAIELAAYRRDSQILAGIWAISGDKRRISRLILRIAENGLFDVRLFGGGGSLKRTVLCRNFPANREKYREFRVF